MSLSKFSKFQTNLAQYASDRGLPAPSDELIRMTAELKEVSDYRDYQVIHAANARQMRVTAWSIGTTQTTIARALMHPKEGEEPPTETSRPLPDLAISVERYLNAVLNFIDNAKAIGVSGSDDV